MRNWRTFLVISTATLVLLLSLPAAAQQTPSPTNPDSYTEPSRRTDEWFKKQQKSAIPANERVVRVVVRDPVGKPIARANIAMKDLATGKIETRQSLDTGEYVFTGLKRTADYEFTAESEGKSSAPRKVSQYLPNQAVSFDLRVGVQPGQQAPKPEAKKSAAK